MARQMAGFATKVDAVRHFGWKPTTYVAHESGQNRFTAGAAELYGRAYGVTPAWLLGEAVPSGLPTTGEWPDAAWSMCRMLTWNRQMPSPDASRRADPGALDELRSSPPAANQAASGSTRGQSGPAEAVLWAATFGTAATSWPVPRGRAASSGVPDGDLAVAVITDDGPDGMAPRAGDHVLIDRSVRNRAARGPLVVRRGSQVSPSPGHGSVDPEDEILGRIIAIVWRDIQTP
ncbi:hypothetical protein [Methylobacterium sp. 1030]|uniref:hypothetical protein n=1 Tax=Methylobacterium sp. 1030 TaxID=3156404 RepID=UPI0033985AA1